MSDPNRDLEPLLSGTLVLMTAAQSPSACVHLPAKIVANLDRLRVHAALSPEFRMVLARLRQHWSRRCACASADHGTAAPPSRLVH